MHVHVEIAALSDNRGGRERIRSARLFTSHFDRMAIPLILPDSDETGKGVCPTGSCLSDTLTLSESGFWNANWHCRHTFSERIWRLKRVSFDDAFRSAVARIGTELNLN